MKRKKRAITLIEIMIVIVIIGLVSGVLAYNFKGSLDKGKQFKTEHAAEQLRSILLLEYAKGDKSIDTIVKEWRSIVKKSEIVVKPDNIMKDARGKEFIVKKSDTGDDIVVEIQT